MANIDKIGSGAIFPITLTKFKDSEGHIWQVPQMEALEDEQGNVTVTPILNDDGTPKMVDAKGWNPLMGDPALINHNIQSLLGFQLGQKMREEGFGTRIWETLEEPNTQLQAFLVKDFITKAINIWEGRISLLDTKIVRDQEKLYIDLHYQVDDLVQQISVEYNSQTDSYNVNY